jgi:hypothetical protein
LSLEGGIASVKEKSIQTFDASIFTKCSSKWELQRERERERERERANDPWVLFLLVSLLLAAKHPQRTL